MTSASIIRDFTLVKALVGRDASGLGWMDETREKWWGWTIACERGIDATMAEDQPTRPTQREGRPPQREGKIHGGAWIETLIEPEGSQGACSVLIKY